MPKNGKYALNPPSGPHVTWTDKDKSDFFSLEAIPMQVVEEHTPIDCVQALVPSTAIDEKVFTYPRPDNWRNRLILGDSLLVMHSLLELEQMAGGVQMVYCDPPYGINYNTKFQVNSPATGESNSKGKHVQAYNDEWRAGLPSYLEHLRMRLHLARLLLHETGSVFVQIGIDHAHLVRLLLDEIFGAGNICDTITVQKTSGFSGKLLPSISDYLLWYAKDKSRVKYHPLFVPKTWEDLDPNLYRFIELPDGTRRRLSKAELEDPRLIPAGARIYRIGDLTSQGTTRGSSSQPFEFEGKTYSLGKNAHWKTTTDGLRNLTKARRIQASRSNIYYVRYFDDFPVKRLSNIWTDTGTGGYTDPKIYAVQTNTKVVQRCVLMTTDPDDLVFDPTCGSGTTAFVAEQWGRRWITCDSSHVAVNLARQRLITGAFFYYRLKDEKVGLRSGFHCKIVPHVKLGDIALARDPRGELILDNPDVNKEVLRPSGPFTTEICANPPVTPSETDGIPEWLEMKFKDSTADAWFFDTRYDGKIFRPNHAFFFRKKSPWNKVQKRLADLFKGITFANPMPLTLPPRSDTPARPVAVKVVDIYGNEKLSVNRGI